MKRAIFNTVIFLCVPVGILTTAIVKREPYYQGKSAAVWVDELRLNRDPALEALQHLGKAALPALKDGLKSPAPTDKCRAAWALGRLGPLAKNAVPDLIQDLDDSRPGVQCEVLESLSRIGITNQEIVPDLQAKLAQGIIDSFAATLLLSMEKERKAENLPPVSGDKFNYGMAFLKSSTRGVRVNGAIKLASLAQKDERAKVALKSLLNDEDIVVRLDAAKLLENPASIPEVRMISD